MPKRIPARPAAYKMVKTAPAIEVDNQRVQLIFSTERVKMLDELAREGDVTTRKDLVNNAITLLAWAVREVKRGRVIASVDEKSQRFSELHMPMLDAVASRSEESQAVVHHTAGGD